MRHSLFRPVRTIPVIMARVFIKILVAVIVIFAALKKVDEITTSITQNTEDISVWKTKSQECDDLIQEFKVKLGLTPKEAVDAWANTILRPNQPPGALVQPGFKM